MVTFLKKVFAPPVLADEKQSFAAMLLNVILWALLGVEILRSVGFFFISGVNLTVSVLATVVVSVVISLLLGLLRSGRVRLVAIVFISFLWGLVTFIIFNFGGTSGVGYFLYVEVIVLAGVLLQSRGIWFFTGLSLIAGVAVFVLEMQGYIHPDSSILQPVITFGISSQIFLVVGALMFLFHHGLDHALHQATINEQQALENNRELEKIRASLEEQVAQRTQVAEEARRRVEIAHAALQNQMWQITGLSQFSDVLGRELEPAEFARQSLQFLCSYTEIAVGMFYLYEKETQSLRLMGTYGVSDVGESTRKIPIQEGVIGQVATDLRPRSLTMSDPPLVLKSSFGEIAVHLIALYPLTVEGALLGVVELGHLQAFSERQELFLEPALSRLAAGLATVLAQLRIKELLEKTQRQAEELQAQEEELRAANEELSAQTESLRAQQKRMESITLDRLQR